MECLLLYLCMVTVPHIMVGLERMLDYRGVGLVRFHCMCILDLIWSTSEATCAFMCVQCGVLSLPRVAKAGELQLKVLQEAVEQHSDFISKLEEKVQCM